MEKTMSNNTTNETATNETTENTNMTNGNVTADEVSESGMLDGILDALVDSPELMLAVAVIGALVAYIAYTQPTVKALIYKFGGSYLKNHEAEITKLLDVHLTTAQLKAYEKLDEVAQKHVKDAMLRNVILSVWDQNDDKFVAVVKAEAKEAMASAKQL